MGEPAWKSIASWYLVAQADQAIPPDAERLFAKRMGATVVEVNSNQLPMVSFRQELAGMDENRTHPGRLSSAPQTVLKTAGGTSPRTSPAQLH